ncbi:hypothetical protein VST7929_01397 [Vibrio stylophorae]|uniref:HDOD domain-containing protein n=1 Tax=Vibrio stylophorae TaxID=659351 RepID=A0ABN8DU17_9VIBR|nr:HDOD domain-containing protein [Vibrio stylophorae]CAH0533527.1 hypothetical protein VST7929_01397 [Vibrio stylophorae]
MTSLPLYWLTPNKQKIVNDLKCEFKNLVTEAIAQRQLKLPPIPQVVLNIQQLSLRDDVTIKAIAKALTEDPSLSGACVYASNSALFSPRFGPCHDILTAVSRLGIARVKDLITAKAIEQLKKDAQFSQECNALLTKSAGLSRTFAATMVLICQEFMKRNPQLELDAGKAMLIGLLADIGLFSLVSALSQYLKEGNYIDFELAKDVMAQCCAEASFSVLQFWQFDKDFLTVAGNRRMNHVDPEKPSYHDIATMANHLLLFRSHDEQALSAHDIELSADGADILYQLSNLDDQAFQQACQEVLQLSGM